MFYTRNRNRNRNRSRFVPWHNVMLLATLKGVVAEDGWLYW